MDPVSSSSNQPAAAATPAPPETARDRAQQCYAAGLLAFERGAYRESKEAFVQAIALLPRQSPLGGEVQIWLVNAYAAMDQMPEAIALCRQLVQHPDYTTRKQSKRLLYILEAPRLRLHPEWMTQIPDLAAIADGKEQDKLASTRYTAQPKRPRRPPAPPDLEPLDLSQVNTQDNQFLWLTLGLVVVLLGGVFWLS